MGAVPGDRDEAVTLCATLPPEWWDTEDDGARFALKLCRGCSARRGSECSAGLPDPSPAGVVRAGVAYSDAGKPLPLCPCDYPIIGYRGGTPGRCHRCLPPAPTWREPDPRGLAAVDEAVVERMLAGNPPDVIRPVDKREALRRLWAAGLTHRQVADRLRMDIEAVRRTYHRMARRAV